MSAKEDLAGIDVVMVCVCVCVHSHACAYAAFATLFWSGRGLIEPRGSMAEKGKDQTIV